MFLTVQYSGTTNPQDLPKTLSMQGLQTVLKRVSTLALLLERTSFKRYTRFKLVLAKN